jgi:signal peptidase I
MRAASAVKVQRLLLRATWFFAVPVALTALGLHYLVPGPGARGDRWFDVLARIGNEFPVLLAVGFFLLFSALLRYWRFELPGRAHLNELPLEIARKLGPERLRAYAPAGELLARVGTRRVQRSLGKLSADERAKLSGAIADLEAALQSDDPDRVRAAEAAVKAGARAALSAQETWRLAGSAAAVGLAVGLALLLRKSVIESYLVTGESMLPTVEGGDRVAANKLAYGLRLPVLAGALFARTPRRGDIVVFENPTKQGPEHLVKRVVGVPGDRIEMHGGRPIINGWEVPTCDAGTYVYAVAEGTVHGRLLVEFLDGQTYLTVHVPAIRTFNGAYVVQPGEVFVLGDNRNGSTDSRTWNEGKGAGVPFATIDGRAQWFLASIGRDGRTDFGRLFRSLGMRPHLEGVDTKALEEGIERCLKNGPSASSPPQVSLAH